MAFKLKCTVGGVVRPESYWKISQRNFNDIRKTGRISVACYEDADARRAGVETNVITDKSFDLTPEEYKKLAPGFSLKDCYTLVKKKLDPAPPMEDEDEDGNPVKRRSFFADAVEI